VGSLLEKMPKEKMFGSMSGDENSEKQNPFDREIKMPVNRQKIAQDRYKEGRGPSSYQDAQEQLYDLYKSISKEIRVETSHYSSSQSMPLVHYGRRFVKEDEAKFRFKGLKVKEDGELGLRTTKFSIDYPVTYKKRPHKIPKFKLLSVDRSRSMALNPDNKANVGDTSFIPWGNKSKAHFAYKGYFGIDNFFERQGIAPYIECCVLGFSGEQPIRGSSELVAKAILQKPLGGTSLDIDGLEKELEDEALVMSISDGEFECERGTYKEYLTRFKKAEEDYKIKKIDKNKFNGEKEVFERNKWKEKFEKKLALCDYAHIQIGEETPYCSFIRELGKPVIVVKGDDDLSNAMVSFVSSYYKKIPVQGGRK